PNAPEGNQVAFLQATGSVSPAVNLAAGAHQLTFPAAQRGHFQASTPTFRALRGGVAVGTLPPPGASPGAVSTNAVPVGAGAPPTMVCVGLKPNGGDHTAYIDNVQLIALP